MFQSKQVPAQEQESVAGEWSSGIGGKAAPTIGRASEAVWEVEPEQQKKQGLWWVLSRWHGEWRTKMDWGVVE